MAQTDEGHGQSTRAALLAQLRRSGGEFISGQQLALQLGVSRAAVNKAAATLQKQGWRLEAVSRRGYRLLSGEDVLCRELLGPWEAPVYFYDVIPSTNAAAKQLALEGAPHGTLVVAAAQSAGRGRLGRSFCSPKGKGLYMTLILRPALSMGQAQAVTGSAAVAVCRAIEALCGLRAEIKWVNDLYYKGKKVCGILTEAATDLETGQLDHVVVGIGVNLTAGLDDFGAELSAVAGSLYPDGVSPVSRAALAGEIARGLLAMCPTFDYLDEYRARCFVPGHWVTVRQTDGGVFSAYAVAIDEAGCLVVETAEGRRMALSHGEVSIKPALVR